VQFLRRSTIAPLRLAPVLVALALLLGAVVPAAAGDAMLTVRNLANPNTPEARFTEEDLLALPQVTIRTGTEFTDGVIAFEGPLARDVISRVGRGTATTVRAVAANDYAVEMPVQEFFKYDVVLALYADGKRLTMRDKGPIWVMYPIDDHAELQDPDYNRRLIWQLTTLELQ